MTGITIRIPGRSAAASGTSTTDVQPVSNREQAAKSVDRGTPNVRAGKENIAPLPSDVWLQNPAWIDGAVNPPQFYMSQAQMVDALQAAANAGIPIPPGPGAAMLAAARAGDAPVSAATARPANRPSEQVCDTVNTSAGIAQKSAAEPTNKALDPSLSAGNSVLGDAGYLVYVTHTLSVLDNTPAVRGSKSAPKKVKTPTTKFEYIDVQNISRVKFFQACLRVHDLADHFSAGVHSGPAFKLWWTGSNGGKAGALTIETDRDFALAQSALLQKNKKTVAVSVEFDTDQMNGFRIRRQGLLPSPTQDPTDELAFGTKVPNVDAFSDQSQIHGAIILELKAKWPCQQHLGEHGEDGFCYVTANAEHIRLNARKLKFWAAAIAAHEATKNEPPNTVEFDGFRDGRLSMARPRGRSGPHPASSSSQSSPGVDTSQLLMAAILSNMNNKRSRSRSPEEMRTPSTSRAFAVPLSPPPAAGTELHTCLTDFLEAKGIDFRGFENALLLLDFTPDVIPFVSISRLCEVTNSVEGRAIKFQAFCKAWSSRQEEKHSYLATKRSRFT
ncbi:hypothetical protein DENSPDRAFT_883621 [Dentipellis sp. KUC8613]|nr:hypothetical protein DENSPDRAFT_883621 [Dentipellis sp. KUC8613]